ncbi:hypothetical protein DFH08DRAFT_1089030, partial [Mycena albidolilacea]
YSVQARANISPKSNFRSTLEDATVTLTYLNSDYRKPSSVRCRRKYLKISSWLSSLQRYRPPQRWKLVSGRCLRLSQRQHSTGSWTPCFLGNSSQV